MTDREEMVKRVDRAIERYVADRMKPWKRRKWGMVKRAGARIPLNEPRRTAELRETAAMFDDADRMGGGSNLWKARLINRIGSSTCMK
jgi:hypothetical protein